VCECVCVYSKRSASIPSLSQEQYRIKVKSDAPPQEQVAHRAARSAVRPTVHHRAVRSAVCTWAVRSVWLLAHTNAVRAAGRAAVRPTDRGGRPRRNLQALGAVTAPVPLLALAAAVVGDAAPRAAHSQSPSLSQSQSGFRVQGQKSWQ